jgi:hypothetical protein
MPFPSSSITYTAASVPPRSNVFTGYFASNGLTTVAGFGCTVVVVGSDVVGFGVTTASFAGLPVGPTEPGAGSPGAIALGAVVVEPPDAITFGLVVVAPPVVCLLLYNLYAAYAHLQQLHQ